MRRFPLLLTLGLVLIPAHIMGQNPPPEEVKHLDMWVGDWTYTISSQENVGTMAFEWFGDRQLRGEEHTPAGWDVIHVMRFDPDLGVYVWNRFWASGYVDESKGWFSEGTWTFLFVGESGNIRRMTMSFGTRDVIDFKWERSVQGGPWEVLSEGKTTRIN